MKFGIFIATTAAVFCALPIHAMSRRPPENKEPGAMRPAPFLTASDINPDFYRGQYCGESEPSVKVISTRNDWEKLWKISFNGAPPDVDFNTHFAVAVFLGSRLTGGYGVEFLPPQADDHSALVRYKTLTPKAGSFVTQSFTQPYAIKIFQATKLKISAAETH